MRGLATKTRSELSGRRTFVFMRLHVDFPSAEAHALGFQSQPLLDRGIPRKLDRAASSQNSLPRKPKSPAQYPCNHPRRARKARRPRHCSVGRHLPARDRANRSLDSQHDHPGVRSFLARLFHKCTKGRLFESRPAKLELPTVTLRRSPECFQRIVFRIVNFEYGQQFGDLQ